MQATIDAARIAGLTVTKLLKEPIAAAYAYGFQADNVKQNILVYDLGGGTFDASIVKITKDQYEVKAYAGKNYLGGEDFN